MATKEYFPGIGKIKFEGVESKTRWLSVIMTQKKSSCANR